MHPQMSLLSQQKVKNLTIFDLQNAKALCFGIMTIGFYLSIYKASEMRGWLFFLFSNLLSLSLELLLKSVCCCCCFKKKAGNSLN